jgi:catechol 2,3-dioxygenase-like lactoylglutathione lyase family enzyme
MNQHIAHIALVVKDYDEAINFFTKTLDFDLIEDTQLNEHKRWVMIAPKGAKECSILLAKASNEEQLKSVGNQTGGRVFLFLFTDDLMRDYEKMISRKVTFVRQPEIQPHGKVAVFEDLYGNLWDLIEPNNQNKRVNK